MPFTSVLPTILNMICPLPGLEGHTAYQLESDPGQPLFNFMVSRSDPGLSLTLVRPDLFFPNYRPRLRQEVLDRLDCKESELDMHLVVSVQDGHLGANLAAPVLVHTESGRAIQAILDDPEAEVFAPLRRSL